MEVILLKDVPGLGRSGEIKEVPEGYARNYLIPKGLAVKSTKGRIKDIELRKSAIETKVLREKDSAMRLAERLKGTSLTFKVRVGEENKLFGSITSGDIAEELNKKGFNIDKHQIVLKEPIKCLGTYEVTVKLGFGVSAPISVVVERE
jgi:large subunit ribosomal protein L9